MDTGALVSQAMETCEISMVYDNSAYSGPRIVAQLAQGFPVGVLDWPTWTPQELSARWPTTPQG